MKNPKIGDPVVLLKSGQFRLASKNSKRPVIGLYANALRPETGKIEPTCIVQGVMKLSQKIVDEILEMNGKK